MDVLIHLDGRVKVKGSNYEQLTDLPGSPVGFLDSDRIVRAFPGGVQVLLLLEDGFREEIILDKKTSHKFLVHKTGKLPARFLEHLPVAVDGKGDQVQFTDDTSFVQWLDQAAYPVKIDPDFTAGSSFGRVRGGNASFSTARSTSSSSSASGDSQTLGMQPGYYIDRYFLQFVTSPIPDDASIDQVNFTSVCVGDWSTDDFDVQIVKQNWSAQDPIAAGTREAAYDGCLAGTADDSIWRNTSGMSLNTQYTSGNLSTAWINKTGNTYYSLRSAEDFNNSSPTSNEFISLATQEHATEAYRPILTVTYSGGASTAHFFSMF